MKRLGNPLLEKWAICMPVEPSFEARTGKAFGKGENPVHEPCHKYGESQGKSTSRSKTSYKRRKIVKSSI